MNRFLDYISRSRTRILEQFDTPLRFCEELVARKPSGLVDTAIERLLAEPADHQDYLIATAYALLIGKERRKYLSAYFTPPKICAASIAAASPYLKCGSIPSVLDPACGGGAFLVPLARHLLASQLKRGMTSVDGGMTVLANLKGVELDPGLATLSRKLLTSMLKREFNLTLGQQVRNCVREADTLTSSFDQQFDLVIGNPPYGRIGNRVSLSTAQAAGRAHLGGHTNFYSLFLLKALDALRPDGGLVFIVPTSFVAGPYFAGLRQEILDRASVVRIDLHQDRENLFIGAIQDVCLVVLQRRHIGERRMTEYYETGFIDETGARRAVGRILTPQGGEPWYLPVDTLNKTSHPTLRSTCRSVCYTLADYGYRCRVGKVVPTREHDALRTKPDKHSLPLLWASAVRPDGSFRAEGGERSKNPLWYHPQREDASYITKVASVIVQRTSNRDQHRRLFAAAVCPKFLKKYKMRGFVAENHVIVLEVISNVAKVSPTCLAQILNSNAANERFSAVSGSFSVSAKLLSRLSLPDPDSLPNEDDQQFSKKLEACFASVNVVLAPLNSSDSPQDAVNQPRNLSRRVAIDDNTRFKARRLA